MVTATLPIIDPAWQPSVPQMGIWSALANVNDTKQGDDIDNVVTSGPKCAKYNKWTE